MPRDTERFVQDKLDWKTFLFKTFGKLYEHDVTYFDAMVNPHVCPEVQGLKSSLQSSGVIVGFTVLKNSLDYLKGLSAKLQKRDVDIFETPTMIENIKSEIQCLRDDIAVEFQRWYDEGKLMSGSHMYRSMYVSIWGGVEHIIFRLMYV